jgi:hypothetical protein
MRLLGAAIFVFVGLGVGIALFSPLIESAPLWVGVPLFVIFFFGLIAAALLIFNLSRKLPKIARDSADDLAARGLLASEFVNARRAFAVQEIEDEGLHFFFELQDERALYLTGQYLYEYAASIGGHPPKFPCSAFEIRRHKTEGYVVQIVCNGDFLQIECEGRFSENWFDGDIPQDGEVIRAQTYDQLKQELCSAAATSDKS